MHLRFIFSLIYIFLGFSSNLCAQKGILKDLKVATAYYETGAYAASLIHYEKVMDQLPKDSTLSCRDLERAAKCYDHVGDYSESTKIYLEIARTCDPSDELILQMGKTILQSGEVDVANKVFSLYESKKPDDPLADVFLKSCDSIVKWKQIRAEYEAVELTDCNTTFAEVAPTFFKGKLIFSSSRPTTLIRKKDMKTNEQGLRLWYATLTDEDVFGPVKAYASEINGLAQEGSISFHPNKEEALLSLINPNKKGATVVGAYKTKRENGKWTTPVAFLFNSDSNSVGHAVFSPDGTMIIFSSNMPGGYGGTDLYYCKKIGFSWSDPVNLGNAVNTSQDELYPFIDEHYVLYFASNGHPGMGGFDIYRAVLKKGQWDNVSNMRPPINSPANDMGFWIRNDSGYFSSNRKQSSFDFNLYRFIPAR